jgi:hypothetical protein
LRPATARRFAAFAARAVEEGTFFVIAVPGSLGLLEPCLKLVRGRVPVALVLNGVPAWEEAALARLQPETPRFRLSTVPGTWWEHGAVLDLLTDRVERPFGLLDPDCYVMDPAGLEGIALGERDLLAAPEAPGFRQVHEASGLRVPRTHLLYLHAERVRAVRRRHGLSCRKAKRAPAALRPVLASLGFGDECLPSPSLGFWDTLQLVMAAGLADGYRWAALPFAEGGLVHLGGATRRLHAGARERPAGSLAGAPEERDER